MKHVITVKDRTGDRGFRYNKGDLVEYTDKFGSKHVMVVIPHTRCSRCCMYRDGMTADSELDICTLDSGASLCHSGWSSKGVSKFVGFKYVDDILEDL